MRGTNADIGATVASFQDGAPSDLISTEITWHWSREVAAALEARIRSACASEYPWVAVVVGELTVTLDGAHCPMVTVLARDRAALRACAAAWLAGQRGELIYVREAGRLGIDPRGRE